MRVVIVDDEIHALESIEHDMEEYCPEFEIIGTFDIPAQAVEFIDREKPDIVLSDIQMPRMDAFAMIEALTYKDFALILVTAYNKYAVRAFEFSAVDYIVKPVDPMKLRNALLKVVDKKRNDDLEEKLSLILHNLKFGKKENHTLAIPTLEGAEFIEVHEITYMKADANYCSLFLKDNTKLLISKPLKHFADILQDHGFIRVHQSYLINSIYIKSYRKGAGGNLILKDGTVIPISRSYKNNVNEFMMGM
jgi:two-component system LytT family response regulator